MIASQNPFQCCCADKLEFDNAAPGGSPDATEEAAQEPEMRIEWECAECIGQGAFGKVYLGLNNLSGELMAVKQVTRFQEGFKENFGFRVLVL